jgi:uncharacterized membrane protein YfcA
LATTVGLVPGVFSGVIGYRRELSGQGSRIRTLGIASLAGGLTGAILLLALPGNVFKRIVPVLILIACVLVAVQPRLSRRLAERPIRRRHGGPYLWGSVFLTGVYGGYFGAAQGVILIALLAIFIDDDLQRLNGAKNVLALLVNGIAALVFIVAAHVSWGAAGLLAISSIVGGQLGATVGRRLPTRFLRVFIVVVGTAVAIRLMV